MKKKIVSLFVLSIFALTLQAYDKKDRIQDMQAMEAAMTQIQKGILYNNNKIVLQGVANLKQTAGKIEMTQKSEMDYSPKFAKKQADSIMKFADEIKENTEAGHKHSAAASYTKILNKCISCHNKIRKWD
ncbi:MAG: hypothetical protein B5M52_04930 [Helicobacteraceae bacterium 4484_230]|nr:MAG: hypothetical protein B5M52_04930 [Helicobacteraceae bacterium 4484_230]